MLSYEERVQTTLTRVRELLLANISQKAPEIHKPVGVIMPLPQGKHSILLSAERSEVREGWWRIQFGVFKQGTDKLYSHFMFHGPEQDSRDWLANKENEQELYNSCKQLMQAVDR